MKTEKSKNNTDIFQLLRERINLKEYCETELGLNFRKSGNSYRATPATGGTDAFTIWANEPDSWHNFAEQKHAHGDVIELCALMNHNGNISEALNELTEKYMTEEERKKYRASYEKAQKERRAEQETVKNAQKHLFSGQYTGIQHWPEYLKKRGLDESDVKRLGLGYDVNEHRLLIPRYDYKGEIVMTHRGRRMPDINGHEANDADCPKYKAASAYNNSFIKNIPIGLQTLKREGALILTEGDFDYFMFEKAGYACLGKIESNSNWTEILNVIEERKEIYLIYDNDDAGKNFTMESAEKLFGRKIRFFVGILPEGCKDVNDFVALNGGNVEDLIANAVDDLTYFASTFKINEADSQKDRREKKENLKKFLIQVLKHGIDRSDFQALISKLSESGHEADWLKAVKKQAEQGETESEIVEAIMKKYALRFNERTGFYKYDAGSGIWEQKDDSFIKKIVKEYLGATASARKLSAVTEHLKVAAVSYEPIEKFNKLSLFGFKNGTLHFKGKGGFKDFDMNDFLTYRLDYDYDSEAKCDEWVKAVNQIFANDEKRVACFQEFCGYSLMTHCDFQKALILRDKSGNGSNGKSTLLNVLKSVFGKETCTNLHPFELADKFSVIHLKDSKVNICTDCDNDIRDAITNLKSAIVGDEMRGCFKNKDFIQFTPTAKFIFAVNGSFRVRDIDRAFERRLLLIDCPVQFIDSGEEDSYHVKKDRKMTAKLMAEKSGIFNWCLIGMKRLIENGGIFTETDEQSELSATFTTATEADSVKEFVNVMTGAGSLNGIEKSLPEMYADYVNFCYDRNIENNNVLSTRKFYGVFEARLNLLKIKYKRWRPHNGKETYKFLQ